MNDTKPSPSCDRELTPADALDQAYLACDQCKGVFFCDDGLAGYVVALTQASVEPVFRQLLEKALAAAPQESTSIRKCPLCQTKLERFGFGDQPLAILDWCPQDNAVWLDEGDLSKVARVCRSEALVTGVLQDADQDGVPDSETEASSADGPKEPPPKEEAPYACPNCAQVFAGSKCPDCNVVGYLR